MASSPSPSVTPPSSTASPQPPTASTPPPTVSTPPPVTNPSPSAPPPSSTASPPPPTASTPPPTVSTPPPVTNPSPSAPPPSSTASPPPPTASTSPPTASTPPPVTSPSPSAPPPSSTVSPPSPTASTPPPTASTLPPVTDTSPAVPPPSVSATPPPVSTPPPSSSPPYSSPPLPASLSPPVDPPPPMSSAPPPAAPPPSSPSPTPPTASPTPPTPVGSPPPPSVAPPVESPPPPSQPSPSPPISPSPPTPSPPTPSPPAATPPVPSPPTSSPPPDATPPPAPARQSPPPPSTKPPARSPPPTKSPSPPAASPPPDSQPPSSSPSPPPSQGRPVSPPPSTEPSPAPPPPTNSSGNPTPVSPQPPVFSPPSGRTNPPVSPTSTNSSNASPDIGASGNDSGGGINAGTVVGIGIAVAVVLLVIALLVWFTRRKKANNNEGYVGGNVIPSPIASSQMSELSYPKSPSAPLVKISSGTGSHESRYSPPEGGFGNSKSWFTVAELAEITNGFSPQNLLGEGGFGCVYKGCLPDGREVAVKQLKVGGGQGEREFQAEVEIISRVHHRHLVSLVGYCISDNQRMLVYEYVPNNTLHYHLHGLDRPVMDWVTRVKVAAGAARGIAYLHEDCHPRIIHRDIKSSNILLDNSFEARVSDFGLAKLTVDAQTHVTTRVMGTFGYLAPEYASSGKLTDRSDVYSFGVVLLELITGRKPVDASQPVGDESLVEWARPLMNRALETRNFDDLPDPRLDRNYKEAEMFRMIEVAAACVRHSAQMRPRMGLVMRALDNLADSVDLHNGLPPGQSEMFNSGANSAEIRLFQRMAFGDPNFTSDFSGASWMSQSHRDL